MDNGLASQTIPWDWNQLDYKLAVYSVMWKKAYERRAGRGT